MLLIAKTLFTWFVTDLEVEFNNGIVGDENVRLLQMEQNIDGVISDILVATVPLQTTSVR